jgi:hypothetical protein
MMRSSIGYVRTKVNGTCLENNLPARARIEAIEARAKLKKSDYGRGDEIAC